MNPESLPVFPHLTEIVAASRSGSLVVTSPPGSGKTTLIPPAILDDLKGDQQLILVQPRRVATRAVVRRIAALRHARLGDEVGYQVRFENATSPGTRLIVSTTGILLRRLIDDLTLPGIATVVLDEFHERTIELDTSFGMLCQLQQTIRPDLRIVVMSATLESQPISRLLNDCPVIDIPGRLFPVEIKYLHRRSLDRLEQQIGGAVDEALRKTAGDVLVFLPGVGEIARAAKQLSGRVDPSIDVCQLFGEMAAEDQDRVLTPSTHRKVILATNIAETSLTIDGVTAVVDSGLARQRRTDASVGIPRLELVPISKASAEQRSGRAGRLEPGICWRLWEAAAHAARPDRDPPEIIRDEPSSTILQLLYWGEREVERFPWIDPPSSVAIESSLTLLKRLGAIDESHDVTEIGKRMVQMPLHPRLARLLISGADYGASIESALAAAMLAERDPFRVGHGDRTAIDRRITASASDIVDRVRWLSTMAMDHDSGVKADCPRETPPYIHRPTAHNVLRVARQLLQWIPREKPPHLIQSADDHETALMRAILDAFPDRLARLRSNSRDRGLMVGGRGVRIDPQSAVRPDELFVGVDIADSTGDATARLISIAHREWLDPSLLHVADELFFNPSRAQVEAAPPNVLHRSIVG